MWQNVRPAPVDLEFAHDALRPPRACSSRGDFSVDLTDINSADPFQTHGRTNGRTDGGYPLVYAAFFFYSSLHYAFIFFGKFVFSNELLYT